MREIFDESAYARFLNQRHLESSRAAYAAFRQEHEVLKHAAPDAAEKLNGGRASRPSRTNISPRRARTPVLHLKIANSERPKLG